MKDEIRNAVEQYQKAESIVWVILGWLFVAFFLGYALYLAWK